MLEPRRRMSRAARSLQGKFIRGESPSSPAAPTRFWPTKRQRRALLVRWLCRRLAHSASTEQRNPTPTSACDYQDSGASTCRSMVCLIALIYSDARGARSFMMRSWLAHVRRGPASWFGSAFMAALRWQEATEHQRHAGLADPCVTSSGRAERDFQWSAQAPSR
jgi:hypothetical protein